MFDSLHLSAADVKQFPTSQLACTTPFVAPSSVSHSIPIGSGSEAGTWAIQYGKLWVVPDAVLPPICMKTGKAVSAAEMQWIELVYSPPYLLWLIFLGPLGIPFMLLASHSISKKCHICVGLSENARAKFALRKTLTGIGAIVVAFAMIVIFLLGLDRVASILFFTSILLAPAIILVMLAKPFKAVKVSDGRYRVKGCGPGFVDALRRLDRG
ncbi:hypothetical protein [Rubripirellula reticaptiva]|nr:hypothetical protein [Rubripirellula reticaptiva]